jgi:hypothetical protein
MSMPKVKVNVNASRSWFRGKTVKPSIDFGDIRSDHFSLSPEIDFSID